MVGQTGSSTVDYSSSLILFYSVASAQFSLLGKLIIMIIITTTMFMVLSP